MFYIFDVLIFFAGKNNKITDITEFMYPLKSKFLKYLFF